MKGQSNGPALCTVFVDYDNIYLSLKRKNDDAAKRFAKDSGLWLKAIESGALITATNGLGTIPSRRTVMSRCYGNPVPRRNTHDNSTDMNSFPFVRHHFLRAGFEAIDCPPLTAQLKNSADIRMVMDVRDLLNHDTYFDEFVILSGDADFTPVLHRLRAHARRTVIFANDHTAAPYTAIADGEVRESDLIALLLEGRVPSAAEPNAIEPLAPQRSSADLEIYAKDILAEVIDAVRTAGQPVPLEAVADRAVRALGHERTVGSNWAGAGTFRELLLKGLPRDVRMSSEPPYYMYDATRQIAAEPAARAEIREPRRPEVRESRAQAPLQVQIPLQAQAPVQAQVPLQAPAPQPMPAPQQLAPEPLRRALPPVHTAPSVAPAAPAPIISRQPPTQPAPMPPLSYEAAPAAPVQAPLVAAQRQATAPAPQPRTQIAETPTAIQQSVARIYEACQAPPLSPPDYRLLFDEMAQELTENGLAGTQTLANIAQRARDRGIEVRREDIKFVLEVVSEADPWFEQGASANLFASRFRNFVVARCRSQGLKLSVDELDLIEAWFAGPSAAQRASAPQNYGRAAPSQPQHPAPAPSYAARPPQPAAAPAPATEPLARGERWWSGDDAQAAADPRQPGAYDEHDPEDLPRIARNRLRG